MAVVYLALGSNVGNREVHIAEAVHILKSKINSIQLSELYETRPLGYSKQRNFINAAVKGRTGLTPEELLQFVKNAERQCGRKFRRRWGPREIDIDILFYGKLSLHIKRLDIPHPRIIERDFVLLPLIDLNRGLHHPSSNTSIVSIYKNLPVNKHTIIKKHAKRLKPSR